MTRTEATAAARKFIKTYVDTGRQWDVGSIEGCLPDGYVLRDVEDGDFFPATVKHVAHVIEKHAVRV